MENLNGILKKMVEEKASDLHLKVGRRPILRVNKTLQDTEFSVINRKDMEKLISTIMSPEQQDEFKANNEVDFAYVVEGLARFRINIFRQRGDIGVVMRLIRTDIQNFKELNLPPVMSELSMSERGLVLITGASSAGKSTTLASMIEYINQHKKCHIVTLENPIEFLHEDKKAVIDQREIGLDAKSYHMALSHVIRQDPDIIVIGELRDPETVRTAISASEAGHLVFGCFHADNVIQSINRLIDFIPRFERDKVKGEIALNLRAIICQRLLKKADGKGLVPACEILIGTPMAGRLIREDAVERLYKFMQTNGNMGMRTFNQSLAELVKKKLVTVEDALSKSDNPEALRINIKGVYLDEDRGIIG